MKKQAKSKQPVIPYQLEDVEEGFTSPEVQKLLDELQAETEAAARGEGDIDDEFDSLPEEDEPEEGDVTATIFQRKKRARRKSQGKGSTT